MGTILVQESLENLCKGGMEEAIFAPFAGSRDPGTEFTSRVLLWERERVAFDQLELRFSNGEFHRRFSQIPIRGQEEFGMALLVWVEDARRKNLSGGHVDPGLRLEIDFVWSSTKRRRMLVTPMFAPRHSSMPFRNVILSLVLM